MVNTTNEPQDKAIHRGEPNHGSVAKNDTTLAILQDLIAELRGMPGFLSTQRSAVERLADRAEQRLREAQGE